MSNQGSGSQAPPPSAGRPPRSSTPSSGARVASKRPCTTRSSSAAAATTPSSAAGSDTPTSSAPPPPAGSDIPSSQPEPINVTSEEEIEIYNTVNVGAKRKLTSDVWLDFKQVVVGGKKKAECIWCKKQLAGGGRDGTNHLRGHLRGCESRQVRKGLQQSTLKLANDGKGGVVVEKYVFDQQIARKELALMICVHEYPLSMVDHARFRTFCAALQPLFNQAVFERLANKEQLCAPFKPTEDDWKFATELCGRLKLFYDATELLSGTNYVTANLFFPKICGIYLAIEKWRASPNPKVEVMSGLMKEKFKYWEDVHGLMEIATVLDPRYKLKFMKAFYSTVHGEENPAIEIEVSRVRTLLYKLLEEYQDSMEGIGTTDAVGAAGRSTVLNEGDNLVFDLFDKFLSEEPEECTTFKRTELDLYLEEPTLPRTQELNIIQWWEYAGVKYPTLRKIARDIMAIPVTTIASESVFSTSGRIISPHRSRLAPKTVEGLMCMQAWSRADMLGDQSCFVNALMTCMEEKDEEDDCESTIID